MTIGFIVFLIGLFGIPLALLLFGRRLRRRRLREQNAFWGAIVGHCLAGVLAITLGVIPPEAWTPGETARGFAGLWGLLVLPIMGAVAGAARPVNGEANARRDLL